MSIQFKMRGDALDDTARKAIAVLQDELNLPRFIAYILVSRGMRTLEAVRDFINPSLERDWRNPYEIPGMADVVDSLEAAIREKKHVIVFGDFDLDGISATTVLTRGLRALGCRATPFIPKRFEEGYGLTFESITRMDALNPDLIVTVDCGISCKEEVAAIVESGIEVVITDHHEAGSSVPEGVPICDPKTVPGCPSAILAGVGVALKVIQALGSRFGYPHLWRSYTDFATLGTVADLMPMRDENRALVYDGLYRMNSDPRPCIAALMSVVGMSGKPLTSTNLSFSLVPRLNAAGRMGDAELALDLLMTDNYDEASYLAERLEQVNGQRRIIEAELSDMAQAQASQTYNGERALVVAGEKWHEGVKGIVASRLVGIYGVPTILFTIDGDQARGSGRSVGKVNLFKAIESNKDMLTKFGGHGAAVGVTLPVENLERFKKALCDYMDDLPESEFHPMTEIDAVVHLEELTLDSVAKIDCLAPFGQENPEPVLLAHNVLLDQCRAVGADKNHFSCKLTDGKASISGIYFHCNDIDVLLENDSIVDAAFTVQIDEWRGRKSVKAMLDVLAPIERCSGLDACVDNRIMEFMESLFSVTDHCERDCACEDAPPECSFRAIREEWQRMFAENPVRLQSEILHAMIGDASPHDSQLQILRRLQAGKSTLGVMATGRGKSLIFQAYAAMLAFAQNKASLFVYPLRALMSDQAYHISRQFERFGLTCAVLSGETPSDERARTYSGIQDGSIDIVLTTPEYLSFHADEVGRSSRIGFMVVDEAHHIRQAKAGTRMSYRQLGEVARKLGNPVVLAVTATAPSDVAEDITGVLHVDGSVIDGTSRDNLHVDDQRGIQNRDDYLAHLVASGEKCIIYVNSREQSVDVARHLRRRVPHIAHMIGFYNAGLTREERTRIEDLFRGGAIRVLVATSAFGEGIDIPDIRHVVLYHMPFSDIEFNQMSGRAGRDGKDSWVHLLYGKQDASINKGILESMTPSRDVMAQVYRKLKALQQKSPESFLSIDNDQLAEMASEASHPVSAQAAACGVAVFSELGLIETKNTYNSGVERQQIRVVPDAKKVELTDSVRYCEGLGEIDSFFAFREWAMKCDIHSLTVRVTHPITPDSGLFQ